MRTHLIPTASPVHAVCSSRSPSPPSPPPPRPRLPFVRLQLSRGRRARGSSVRVAAAPVAALPRARHPRPWPARGPAASANARRRAANAGAAPDVLPTHRSALPLHSFPPSDPRANCKLPSGFHDSIACVTARYKSPETVKALLDITSCEISQDSSAKSAQRCGEKERFIPGQLPVCRGP